MIQAKAVRIREPGEVDVLVLADLEVRDPGPGEVRVAVAAAGLNRADILQRRGFYPAPPGVPADVPGLEYSGTVEAVGPGVTSVRLGDRVMGIVAGGSMATHLVVHERELLPVPAHLSLTEAAAIPEVYLTAYDALFLQAELALGETVLVHAVGSGVGTASLLLAQAAGAKVLGTSRTPEKLARCRELGLEHGIEVKSGAFADAVREETGGRMADVVIDFVGGAYLEENVRALATLGRIVVVGLLGGAKGSLPLGPFLAKRGRLFGTVLRSRPLEEKAALAQRFARDVLPLFAAGRLRPLLEATLPMTEVHDAHRRMESNETFGKIVLTW